MRSDFIIHTYVVTPEIFFTYEHKTVNCYIFCMFFHLLGKIDSWKEPLSGSLGILAFSSTDIAGFWQGRCKLLSCKPLNAVRAGTWLAVIFPIPCELSVKGDKHSAEDKQWAERLQPRQSHSGKNLFRNNTHFPTTSWEMIFTGDGNVLYKVRQLIS